MLTLELKDPVFTFDLKAGLPERIGMCASLRSPRNMNTFWAQLMMPVRGLELIEHIFDDMTVNCDGYVDELQEVIQDTVCNGLHLRKGVTDKWGPKLLQHQWVIHDDTIDFVSEAHKVDMTLGLLIFKKSFGGKDLIAFGGKGVAGTQLVNDAVTPLISVQTIRKILSHKKQPELLKKEPASMFQSFANPSCN